MTAPSPPSSPAPTAARRAALTATLYGFVAVLMWSTLALFTVASGALPPFQLLAMCFTIAAALAVAALKWQGVCLKTIFRQPPAAWLLGVGGLFGYHALYFYALRHAPPAEAGLIAYLWPLLIVLFSALLPGERLRWFHAAGALCGFGGAALLLLGDDSANTADTANTAAAPFSSAAAGYLAAAAAALVWGGYSVLSRRFARVPTAAVSGFLIAAAALGGACHLAFENTQWPANALQWGAVLLLGAAPVGGAFFFWDIGVKRGNLMLLGALSYFAPLLSTLLLLAFGYAVFTRQVALAAVLISSGALIAAKNPRR